MCLICNQLGDGPWGGRLQRTPPFQNLQPTIQLQINKAGLRLLFWRRIPSYEDIEKWLEANFWEVESMCVLGKGYIGVIANEKVVSRQLYKLGSET